METTTFNSLTLTAGAFCTKGHFSSIQRIIFVMLALRSKTPFIFPLTIAVNARLFGNAGASVVQELAFALAMGAEYMCMLTDQGISARDAAGKMEFHFAISPDYFLEIAKYRAARFLWAKILSAFDAIARYRGNSFRNIAV
jgi:methylmalonyl-CoA mutase N-terminal domain/subunit